MRHIVRHLLGFTKVGAAVVTRTSLPVANSTRTGECKGRWKNLRGSLTRNLSQRLKSYGDKKPKTFYLTKHMEFIMPFAKSKHGRSYEELKLKHENATETPTKDSKRNSWDIDKEEIEIDDGDTDTDGEASTSEPPIVLANNIQHPSTSVQMEDPLETHISEQTDHNDADRHFLLSLLPHINCFTPNEKLQFQIKILTVIDEIMNKREIGNKD